MTHTVEHFDIETARAAYDEARAQLVDIVGGMFADGEDAADALLVIAEEYGADQATLRFLENAEGISPLLGRTIESQVADQADTIEHALERVMVAQDRLDLATAKRETRLVQAVPSHQRVVNIGGREFVIDTQKRELRSVDTPSERYELGPEISDRQAPGAHVHSSATLTESFARENDTPAASPNPDLQKTRSR